MRLAIGCLQRKVKALEPRERCAEAVVDAGQESQVLIALAVGYESIRIRYRRGPSWTTPMVLPAGSRIVANQRTPPSSDGPSSTPPPLSATNWSVASMWSTLIHANGPASGAGARSSTHWPISCGASKLG